MPPILSPRVRTTLPIVVGAALVVLAAFALRSLVDLDVRLRNVVTEDLEDQLGQQVASWERNLRGQLDDALDRAVDDPAIPGVRQEALRRRFSWFEALYLWEFREGTALPGALPEVRWRFPTRPPGDDADLEASACVQEARDRSLVPEPAPEPDANGVVLPPPPPSAAEIAVRLADALLETCADAPLTARVYASTEAAQTLREAGLHAQALAALDVVRLEEEVPFAVPVAGVPLAQRVSRRFLRADLMESLGQVDRALDLRARTAFDIVEFDAPRLEATLFFVPGVVEDLQARGRRRQSLQEALGAAEDRLAAWRDVRQLAERPLSGDASEGARFSYDPYSETPYLLYFRRTAGGGGALQLDQDALIRDFLAALPPSLRDDVVVTDATGRSLAGQTVDGPTAAAVPLQSTLRHLRVGVPMAIVDARVAPLEGRATFWTSMVVVMGTLLVAGGLYLILQADARQRGLLARQREFTTRVTHELKTPLAGIRVMAENLALGVYKTSDQQLATAESIIDEADRLRKRIDEILNVARERELPDPEPFDLEEPLLELIEEWGPRYDRADVRLLAELDPVESVLGDVDSVRDALACLLDNALKYRREDVASQVWLNLREVGRWAQVEVVDNGLGVPPDQRETIFERFARVEGPNRGKAGGHGLGLAQVHEIVTAHDGTVTCEPGVDGGARFVIRLPTIPA